ncbi:hypothetical protein EIN_508780 [Entamoeba invadens IP1]|uniref:EGF-like domain-containing protein n=1 Tax=Entamoeba invadens IP1 TaxID=370355 RepID=A0A0A1UCB5_ENTIV|nr:hypothetical protein EIN_508780 [Entamoeba invadens IP1]ELP92877.1 hypothetical protein EIN_508780 [Entamoeba invadens IP1]|eukprot:XP_004259648.1 hypothetical protein EIN_508780 [Entamoeba invadens IP1]
MKTLHLFIYFLIFLCVNSTTRCQVTCETTELSTTDISSVKDMCQDYIVDAKCITTQASLFKTNYVIKSVTFLSTTPVELKESTFFVSSVESVISMGGFSSMGNTCFSSSHIRTINLRNMVSINDNTFHNTTKLVSIIGMDSVTSIGYQGLAYSSVSQIKFGPHSLSVGSYGFSNCLTIKKLHFPGGLISADVASFINCKNLTDIDLTGLPTVPAQMLSGCTYLVNITSMIARTIDLSAFYSTPLSSITIYEYYSITDSMPKDTNNVIYLVVNTKSWFIPNDYFRIIYYLNGQYEECGDVEQIQLSKCGQYSWNAGLSCASCGPNEIADYEITHNCYPMCRSYVHDCKVCSSSTTCQECEPSFLYIGGQCQTCQYYGECYECDINKCTACSANYKYDAEKMKCGFCELESGYYIDGNDCNKCNENCTLCTSATVCTECKDGFYLKDNTCLPCTLIGCFKCTEFECLECQTGFYLNDNKLCSLCSEFGNCIECTIEGCTTCLDHMYYNTTTRLCDNCVEGCDICDNSFSCNTCHNTYYHYKEDEMKCATCPIDNGDYLKGMNCKNCIKNCLSCTESDNCQFCENTFYSDIIENTTTNVCMECTELDSKCLLCSNEKQCTTCYPSYGVFSGRCQKCSEEYFDCEECNDTVCLQCGDITYLDNGKCTECGYKYANCATCNETECLSCITDFSLYEEKCVDCVGLFGMCDSCSSDECLHCKEGASQVAYSCYNCSEYNTNCVECDSSTCLRCKMPFTLNGENCFDCSDFENCEICNSTHCIACKNGFVNLGDNFAICGDIPNCSECDQTSCISCNLKFFLNDKTCENCIENLVG